MTVRYSGLYSAILGAFGLGQAANAQLLGTSVTGSYENTETLSPNLFDPLYGLVAPTYLNYAGTTVTIGDPAIEFGAASSPYGVTADFTDSLLTVNYMNTSPSNFARSELTFTDTAFSSISEVSDTFGSVTYGMQGDTIKLDFARGGSGTAVFD